MEEQRQQPQGPLPIDWSRQFQHDSPPREVVVVPSSTVASDQDDLNSIADHKLKESIQSKKRTLDVTGKNLPDNGAKLRATIERYQQELSRRELMRLRQEVDEDQKQPEQATSSSAVTEGDLMIFCDSSNKVTFETYVFVYYSAMTMAWYLSSAINDSMQIRFWAIWNINRVVVLSNIESAACGGWSSLALFCNSVLSSFHPFLTYATTSRHSLFLFSSFSCSLTFVSTNDLREENSSSQVQPQSSFTSLFVEKMQDNTSCTASDAFKKEMSHFKHRDNQKIQDNTASDAFKKETSYFKQCDNQKIPDNGASRRRKRHRSSSRQLQFRCPSKLSKHDSFSDGKTCRATSTFALRNIGRNLSRCYPKVSSHHHHLLQKITRMISSSAPFSNVEDGGRYGLKDTSQAIQLDGPRSRKGQPIVLDVDDDDDDDEDDDKTHIVEKTENRFSKYLKEAKIYFPSRDDPECVEICYTDTDCLAPEGYLTSTIMNFYIQSVLSYLYLTFYSVLGLLLMIFHISSLHWSLIIICIPDKEDESGPIILHLDSLGLHSSRSVFDNIKSYLIEEKNYMDRENVSSDVSIADRIWKCLPRRIESQIIAVPQQKNEYDCGLFVLYFIERFMEEAPERLKRKDLAMFGKRWFRPEEASNLRLKIRKLLLEKLQNSIQDNCDLESSPSSSAGPSTDSRIPGRNMQS
ncbi:unnamed protein product [Sphenostylis stenocarpa]|uniref:Ubiquitin-like protease family profile domain-containing protein n=1 Tax=Sphenostylis stenocarpa TaxID=92480 RepID=A0AA86V7V4_9FABA|nr:unnamed protein product [Sphenostylis stenocarpa]